jgi:two-component system NarL family sensor kinase
MSGTVEGLTDVSNTVLFRIAQEALTNIRRHANASEVHIRLIGNNKNIKLIVADNGVGFDIARVAQHPKRGIGLRNMDERLEEIGGTLNLISSPEGTQVIADLYRG